MTTTTDIVWLKIDALANNSPQGQDELALGLPTLWNPAPFLEWTNPDWQDMGGNNHYGTTVSLFQVKQAESVMVLGRIHAEERNRWLVRVQNRVFPGRVEEKICEHDEVVAMFGDYLQKCHPK